jgi:chemotaxis protein methyltransferase CheR
VGKAVRSIVRFRHLNLIESWPFTGPFDFIFCRNVMIYFDKATQGKLVKRFWDVLPSGGLLFIGHSESLTGIDHHFRYVEPTIYERP